MRNRIVAVLGATLVAVLALVAVPVPAFAANEIYEYAAMTQGGWGSGSLPAATKLSANLDVDTPYVDTWNTPQDHSLVQLELHRTDTVGGVTHNQRVEVGWCVNCHSNGESSARLFTSAWVDDTWLGYGYSGGSGFVATCPVTPCTANDAVLVAGGGTRLTSKPFVVEHMTSGGNTGWWVGYDSKYFGYWPDSLWAGALNTFQTGTEVQVFAESMTNQWNTGGSCSDFFDGTDASLVSDTVGAFAGSTTVNGSSAGVSMSIINTKPAAYKAKLITGSVRSMRFTGDGDC